MASGITAPAPAPGAITHRKNILDLTAAELAALRDAFSKVYRSMMIGVTNIMPEFTDIRCLSIASTAPLIRCLAPALSLFV